MNSVDIHKKGYVWAERKETLLRVREGGCIDCSE